METTKAGSRRYDVTLKNHQIKGIKRNGAVTQNFDRIMAPLWQSTYVNQIDLLIYQGTSSFQ